ncbi:MAG: hypothetical protein IK056_00595, partial [Clostridia bacterium]|nr:hypothetical protein [Clostridia bacterium]
MKKTLMIILALLLALTPLALAEDEAPAGYDFPELTQSDLPVVMTLPGEWYADLQGLAIKLTLSGDGAYALEVPGSAAQTGAWEINEEDGMLYLGGNEAPLLPLDDAIIWNAANLVFRRDAILTYTPAEVYTEAQAETFNGWWHAHFTQVGGARDTSKRPAVRSVQAGGSVILSSFIDDDTALYIENGKAALAGQLFGRQLAEFSLKNGVLTAEVDDAKVTLAL